MTTMTTMTTKTVQSSLLATLITVASSHAAITWNFDDGAGNADLNGWTIVAQNTIDTVNGPIIQVLDNTFTTGASTTPFTTAPLLTTAFQEDGVTKEEVFDVDLIARSPTFNITTAGSITWFAAGGNGLNNVPTGSAGNYTFAAGGVIGVALIDASDDSIVTFVANNTNNNSKLRSINVNGLANDGKSYFLEVIDTDPDGGWAYSEWDSFSVPGAVVVPEPSSFLLGCSGLLVLLRRRRA